MRADQLTTPPVDEPASRSSGRTPSADLGQSTAELVQREDIETPALIIDLDVVERNIRSMQDRADRFGVGLRPHIKSHKAPELARMQLRAGAAGITVAKVGEAEVMVDSGVLEPSEPDVLIANQVLGRSKMSRLKDLARRARLQVGVDSVVGARALSDAFGPGQSRMPALIEIDCGLGRCGVEPGQPAIDLLSEIRELPGIRVVGLFTHAGQAYGATGLGQVISICRHESTSLTETAAAIREALGHQVDVVSVGSTPTMSVWSGHPGITELRPGNYVLNDAMQVALGTARPEDCSLSVLATIISRPAPGRAIIDAGSKVLALDTGAHGTSSVQGHGMTLNLAASITRLSEEHGVLELDQADSIAIGDRVRVIPNHACPVMNLADSALAMRDGQVVGTIEISARGKVR